ncbi:MAG: hypothetical protein H6559_21430 [Lewinellaceae bacterium]|nr:hypothetical protein [Lewinellaceae bacterium]
MGRNPANLKTGLVLIILGNLSQMVLGVIDSAMVGAIHSSQLVAASFVNNIITLPLILGIGLTMVSPSGTNALGEGDTDKPLRILYNGMWIVGLASLAMALALHLGEGIVYHMGQDRIVADLSGTVSEMDGMGHGPHVPVHGDEAVCRRYLGKTRLPMYLACCRSPSTCWSTTPSSSESGVPPHGTGRSRGRNAGVEGSDHDRHRPSHFQRQGFCALSAAFEGTTAIPGGPHARRHPHRRSFQPAYGMESVSFALSGIMVRLAGIHPAG